MHSLKTGNKWLFGIMSTLLVLFRYKNQVHTFACKIWPFMYKTGSGFSGSVILRSWPLKFPITCIGFVRKQKTEDFVGICLKINQKLHGDNRKHIRVWKKKIQNQHMSYFFTPCILQLFTSQHRAGDSFLVLFECIRITRHWTYYTGCPASGCVRLRGRIKLNFSTKYAVDCGAQYQ